MIGTILGWLGGPIVSSILGTVTETYKAKLAAGNDAAKISADLAARELAVQATEVEANNKLRIAQLGYWYEPDKLMGYAVAIYIGKLLVWDKVLGLGSTDPLGGWIDVTANMIVGFYFGKRGIENVVKILKR